MPTSICIALDGPRQRNLRFFAGDDVGVDLTIYAKDGDVVPIEALNPRFVMGDDRWIDFDSIFQHGYYFERETYRLVCEITGATTTVAFGHITIDPLSAGARVFETTIYDGGSP